MTLKARIAPMETTFIITFQFGQAAKKNSLKMIIFSIKTYHNVISKDAKCLFSVTFVN